MKTRVIVTPRTYDYHACIDGRPEIWGCGVMVEVAVDHLVIAHRDEFKGAVEIVFDYMPRALRSTPKITP